MHMMGVLDTLHLWLLPSGLLTTLYMWHAYVCGTIVALTATLVGYFVVLRGVAFMAHSLPKIGFAGVAGATVLQVPPLVGLLTFNLLGGLVMSTLSRRGRRDVVTALTLVLALGAGELFLTLGQAYGETAYALLFGQIVGISGPQVGQTLAVGLVTTGLWMILYRPLLFVTVARDQALARGVRERLLDNLFAILVGLVCVMTVPVVGALLGFSLLIGPVATASLVTRRGVHTLLLAGALGLAAIWLALLLAYDSGWPVGFFATTIIVLEYKVVYIGRWVKTRRALAI
ncbi:metal ABC transporter permease [Alicyclobacillus shizuokensis]|uniref:metal ABC transporter permease n=1 Tax=Alicyclobacillus shizuokensis TaxID=392014 RepID=UPI0008310E2D|nr:metal ABC transporter permease [Alicyclobacillus shizuokensis]